MATQIGSKCAFIDHYYTITFFIYKKLLSFEPRWPLSDGETTKVFLRVWHMAKSRHLLCKVNLPVLKYQNTHINEEVQRVWFFEMVQKNLPWQLST